MCCLFVMKLEERNMATKQSVLEGLKMADTKAKQPTETVQNNENRLKYLDIVQVTAIYIIVCFSSLYESAKENSGPLKPGVQTVEATVKTVILRQSLRAPQVNRSQDYSLNVLDRHAPSLIKQALSAAKKAPEVTRALASAVQQTGVVDTMANITIAVYTKYEPTAKELYVKYEPMEEQYAVSAWQSMNRLPLFPQVAGIVVPTAAYWTNKYDQAVCYTAEKGFTVAAYMPLVPIDRIAKVFEEAEHGPAVSTNGGAVPVTQ
ncbi:unnamed protein product [Camellia sinensis]